jgi:virulence-associated protein VagC
MQIAEIVEANGSQLVKLSQEFHLEGDTVSIRRQGEAIILEPAKPSTWPAGFFDRIFIEDPSFARQPQWAVPPAPKLD